MKTRLSPPRLHSACWTIGLTCLSTIAPAQPLWANFQATEAIESQIIFNAPPPPTDQGSPTGRSQGGASRGQCQQYQSLTALVPVSQGNVWGLTTREHPSFWFYLPSALTAETSIEFVLQDETDQELYRTSFTAPDTQPGLISLAVPTTAPALEIDKAYSWTLVFYCNPAKPSESVYVQGSIQRTDLSPQQQAQLRATTPLEQARLYAADGIWYEALATLADLHRAQPNQPDIKTAWTALLKQVNLESLAEQPISSCCTPEVSQ
ncbi:DUF928 domain-containing protein [Phormidium tenue FACHB-886]|nr:DUF928 domain-containing protein [Phormidium tenue FACHB-886]